MEQAILLIKAPPKKKPHGWVPRKSDLEPSPLRSCQRVRTQEDHVLRKRLLSDQGPLRNSLTRCLSVGSGGCGWHSVAAGLLIINQQSCTESAQKAAPVQAKTLSCDIHAHVSKHPRDYEPSWAIDPNATTDTEAGEVRKISTSGSLPFFGTNNGSVVSPSKPVLNWWRMVQFGSDDTPLEPRAFGN